MENSYATNTAYKVSNSPGFKPIDTLDNKYSQSIFNKTEQDGQGNLSFQVNYMQNPEEEKPEDSYLMSIEAQKTGVGYVAIKPEDRNKEAEGLEKEMETKEIKAETDGRTTTFSVESSGTLHMEDLLSHSKKSPVDLHSHIGNAVKKKPWEL